MKLGPLSKMARETWRRQQKSDNYDLSASYDVIVIFRILVVHIL